MSAKHDVPRVRTAEDLERKYKLSEMKKTFEMVENVLTKVNQNIADFVNLIVGSLESFEGTADGQIVTYFYNGVPTMENYPVSEWGDTYENHIEDLYYDRDEGKIYTFKKNNGVYEWVITDNADKIRAMAIANATIDTKDNFRRIFVEQPTPPYANGDLWLKTGEIFVCQITKASTESFEDKDFILSTSYVGDTLAFKVGNELQVLKGSVLTIQENNDSYNVRLEDLDKKITNEINLSQSGLEVQIQGLRDSTNEQYTKLSNELNKFTKLFQFTDNGFIVGEEGSSSKIRVDNDIFEIIVGNVVKQYFDALGRGYIPSLIITEQLELLGIGIVEENGHIYASFEEGDV